MKQLILGLPKGSLQQATFSMMQKAGFNVQSGSRSYLPSVDDPELDNVSDNNDPTLPFPAGTTGFHSVSGSYDSAVDIFGAQVNWRFN